MPAFKIIYIYLQTNYDVGCIKVPCRNEVV